MGRRVVITGLGPISSLGIGREVFWTNLIKGKSGISQISLFDPEGYTSKIGGQVLEFNPIDFIDAKEARRMDRFTQFAVAAASLALKDSNFEITDENADNVGVIVGSGIGGLKAMEDGYQTLIDKGPRKEGPFLVSMMITDSAAGQISLTFGARGPNFCTTSACATSNHAIGEAYETIKRGSADIMITGGSEAPITRLGVAAFCGARSLSTRNDEPEKASRPFDVGRDGFVIAEGAGVVILEELSHALSRNAKIYAEVIGYGATADAYHTVQPDPTGSGAMRSMKMAINEAGIQKENVDYVNAHGTSTDLGDIAETKAIKNLFKDHAYKLLISSTKSMTGHLLGAAGAIELIACALAVDNGVVPPTINLDNADPECDLNYVPNKAVEKNIKVALSNSFGFGGHNASLLIKSFEE